MKMSIWISTPSTEHLIPTVTLKSEQTVFLLLCTTPRTLVQQRHKRHVLLEISVEPRKQAHQGDFSEDVSLIVAGKRLRWSRGSVLAFGTQVRGFAPGRSRWIFRPKKILSTLSFGGEVKPSVPCRSFTACKRSINVTWKSAFRQNFRTFLASSSIFRRWALSRGDTRGDAWWRNLERLTQIAQ